ncbi:MAG: Mrp/NBP35 family ATP-binding protein [Anaerolineaceae bacterium]|nr:Mrp/NBP35 family ATP-binding protein [Anaerolineaceae bacterium]
MPDEKVVMEALNRVMDPELHRSLVDLGMVRDLKIEPQGKITFTLALTIPSCPLREHIAEDARRALLVLPGVNEAEVVFGAMTPEERSAVLRTAAAAPLPKINQFNKVKHLVAVMSGKGGVGKSSVTALLAVTLARQGYKVGILDADITGPSIPKLFGLPPGGLRGGEQGMLPVITRLGIKVVSANLLVKAEDTAVIWRGPVISGAIQRFWNDVLWGKLDYLFLDLPPGTSDAALTVVQRLPIMGAVLVTTPQDLSALVVRKAMAMLAQLNISILGVVENMSFFQCTDCGSSHEIFGPSHLAEIQEAAGHELPAVRLPILPAFTALADAGKIEEAAFEAFDAFVPLVMCTS